MLLRSWKSRLGLVLGLWAFGVAWADMAQSPLLSRTVNVKPNVALILDTSSSMNYACVYAPAVNAGILNPSSIEQSLLMNVPNPVRLKAGMVDPCWDTTDYLDSNSVLYALQGNRIQMNPFTNHLYYNPRKTYARGYVAGVQQAAPSSSKSKGADAASGGHLA